MKKFYIPIFTVVFLSFSFLSQGQTVYNSITSNPNNYTLDDARFWQGGVVPVTGGGVTDLVCTGCILNIYSNVNIVGYPGDAVNSSDPATAGIWLNHLILDNSIIKLQGTTTAVNIYTYVSLINGSQIALATSATFAVSVNIHDQVDMDASSSIQLGNITSSINTNVFGPAHTVLGPYVFFDPGDPTKYPGIYAPLATYNPTTAPNAYTIPLNPHYIGTLSNPYMPNGNSFYDINCDGNDPTGTNSCGDGFVYGPALTSVDATYGIIFNQSTTLPVQLVQFLANKTDEGLVKLTWATAQEQNSKEFDVERSDDQAAWAPIGTVKAKGYASTTSNYNFTDKDPVDGTGYYRLKMVDINGVFKYSKTVSVSGTKDNRALTIYSNPFSDVIRMKIVVSRAQNLSMTVSDMVGKTIISTNKPVHIGENFIDLQPNGARSGMYILRIHGDTFDQTVKLEKQ